MELIAKSTVDFPILCAVRVWRSFNFPVSIPTSYMDAVGRSAPPLACCTQREARRPGRLSRFKSACRLKETYVKHMHKVTKKIRYWPSIFRKLSFMSF